MIVNCCNPQPKRINKPQRIAFHIPIGIQPPFQPNRVTLDIAPRPRVIVPEVVVVQARIGIEHLPGKAQGDVGGNAVLVGVLLGLGGACLVSAIGTSAAASNLSKQVDSAPLALPDFQAAQSLGEGLNRASISLLSVGLALGVAGGTWAIVNRFYGRQHKTP